MRRRGAVRKPGLMSHQTTFAALMTAGLESTRAATEEARSAAKTRARELAQELLAVVSAEELVVAVAESGMALAAVANRKLGLDPLSVAFEIEADVMRNDDEV